MRTDPGIFLADVPDTNAPQVRVPDVLKRDLVTPDTIDAKKEHQALTSLANSIEFQEWQVRDYAASVYMLIDGVTRDDDLVDPILAQTYQALVKAAQLLSEGRMHIYRYANKLDVLALAGRDTDPTK